MFAILFRIPGTLETPQKNHTVFHSVAQASCSQPSNSNADALERQAEIRRRFVLKFPRFLFPLAFRQVATLLDLALVASDIFS